MALPFKMFTVAEAISKAFRENTDKKSGQHSVNLKNTLGEEINNEDGSFVPRDWFVDVGLGRIDGAEGSFVYGRNTVLEGVANEACVGEGQTGRYQFPSAAAQMTLVSDSSDDDLGGTGANVVLVRGLIADMTELFEAVIMDGINPVTTSNAFYRVNSILIALAGSGKTNAGTITLKNGADLLQQMNPGTSVSRTAVFSVPIDVTVLQTNASLLVGKDQGITGKIHLYLSELPGIDFTPLEQEVYQNQVNITGQTTFPIQSGSDIELTAYSVEGIASSNAVAILELTLVDNETI